MFSNEIILAILKTGLMLGGIMTAAAYFVLLERRVAAYQANTGFRFALAQPLGMVTMIAVAILYELQHRDMLGGWFDSTFGTWTPAFVAAVGWVVGLVAVFTVALIGPPVTDNRPRRQTQRYTVDDQI
jgi:hypothetical protein